MSIGKILEDVSSDDGMRLRTLRALLAAGVAASHKLAPMALDGVFQKELGAVSELIEEKGIAVCARAVGDGLRAFLSKSQPGE
jgi:hypothetical protein